MSFFISDAMAAAPAAVQQPSLLETFGPLIVIFVVFYFLLIRPQSKKAKEHKEMLAELQKGDEVVTSGGILGKITKVSDNFVDLEISGELNIKVQISHVSQLMPKGTMKNS